jgi:sugar lactone lactonase YvrE
MSKIIEMRIDQPLLKLQNQLGESPLWDTEKQILFWLDIERGQVQTFHPSTKEYRAFDLGNQAGCIAFTQNGNLLVATPNGLAFWNETQGLGENQVEFFGADDERMMNDGKVDPHGNFWVGSKGPKKASSLYRVKPDFSYDAIVNELTISNGLDWSPDQQYFFLCDSGPDSIYRYKYTASINSIAEVELFFTSYKGTPDGLTVDSYGNVWIAIWDGWKVIGLTPGGKLFCQIHLPVSRPTSLVFGGPELNELFITSARTGLTEDFLKEQPLAGSLFTIKLNTQGVPGYKFID